MQMYERQVCVHRRLLHVCIPVVAVPGRGDLGLIWCNDTTATNHFAVYARQYRYALEKGSSINVDSHANLDIYGPSAQRVGEAADVRRG